MKKSTLFQIFSAIATLIITLTLASPVSAQSLIGGDTVPEGTILNQDVILTGQNVSIDGTVNGNVFILGNQVAVKGEVNGSLILVGQNAKISGNVTGGVYAAAVTLQLSPNSLLERDLYVATVSLTSGKNSLIGRDLYAVGLDSGLNGRVNRNLHTALGPIQLYNSLMTLLGFSEFTIKFNSPTSQNIDGNNSLSFSYGHLARLRLAASSATFDWGKWAISLLRNWGTLFIISLLLFWFAGKILKQSGEPIGKKPWGTLGLGLLVMVFSIILIGVFLLLSALVFEIGLGLNYLGVWQISLALWVVAYSSLALILAGIWFFFTFGTKIIALFSFSRWVIERLIKRNNLLLEVLGILVATILYTLLRSVPYVGWVFGVLLTALGAGAAWQTFRQFRGNKPPQLPEKISLAKQKAPVKQSLRINKAKKTINK